VVEMKNDKTTLENNLMWCFNLVKYEIWYAYKKNENVYTNNSALILIAALFIIAKYMYN
jgi:hypothetical protein